MKPGDQRLVGHANVSLEAAQRIAETVRRRGDIVEHAEFAQVELLGEGEAEEIVADGMRC